MSYDTTWHWANHSFRAMNTGVQLRLLTQQDNSAAVLQDVQQLFHSFERRLSRFDADSELSQLNEQTEFKASPTLFEVVKVALWAAGWTNGLYDPTILNMLEAAGYDRSFEQLPQAAPLTSLTADNGLNSPRKSIIGGYQAVALEPAGRYIRKPEGVRLDLGGMGKGWSVDRAADRLQGLGPFLVNAGGDIYAYQTPPGSKGWSIDLIHPLHRDKLMARLRIEQRGLATSTLAKRRWRQGEQLMHHLIDPRTGRPAQTDALSVTVVTSRTVLAEIYAKVVLILGVAEGLDYLQNMPGIEGLIFTAAGEIELTPGLADLLEWVEPAGRQL